MFVTYLLLRQVSRRAEWGRLLMVGGRMASEG